MRPPAAAAALLAAAVAGVVALLPVPSSTAQASSKPAPVRSAYLPACPAKDSLDSPIPCGHWRLLLRDGKSLTVRDAAKHPTRGNGEEIDYLAQSFEISADGRVVAYWRTGDHRLVVRRVGGSATVLPAGLRPKGLGTLDLQIELSPTGDKLLIDYVSPTEYKLPTDHYGTRLPSKVVTVATGKVSELPAAADVFEFSGDGDEVLASRWEPDRLTALYAYPLDGSAPVGGKLPRVVAERSVTEALAPDGKTLAWVLRNYSEKKRSLQVRLYGLESGEMSPAVDVPLKGNEKSGTLRYDPDGTLQLLTMSEEEGKPMVVRVLDVDPLADSLSVDLRQSDRYSVTDHRYAWFPAGDAGVRIEV